MDSRICRQVGRSAISPGSPKTTSNDDCTPKRTEKPSASSPSASTPLLLKNYLPHPYK